MCCSHWLGSSSVCYTQYPTKLKREPRPENVVVSLHYCWARFEISTQARVTDKEQRTISSLSFLSNHIAGSRLSRGHTETRAADCRLCRHCRLSWLCRLQSAGCADFAPLDCSLFRLQTLQTLQTVQTRLFGRQTAQPVQTTDCTDCPDYRQRRLLIFQTAKTVQTGDYEDCGLFWLQRLRRLLQDVQTVQTVCFFHKSVT